ncbi:transglycosylase domain-containing protein [Microbacterium sp. SORGH_AS_0862]|uniref:transglycosylase domain-containing protein n=1 Tax=Microbacterium sp. SORGH_AS_0862 TaxID=3041789 RepID=UPI00278FA21E|nr:transglycosylase domain-containing protein [Microbacterium sp. SORGH_AS_0862]MDQ1206039.1 membrane peptidoglycan carboxypeptidase [Microbacterium sp. SORGH_AS_0862]
MPDKKRTATGVLSGLAGLVGLSVVAGVLITATVTPAIAVTGAATSQAIKLFDNMPNYLEIDDIMEPSTIYWKDGTGNYAPQTSFYDQNRSPVTFDQIATVMYDAILSSEDPRYYDHGGVDLIGTTRAVLSNLEGGGNTQGGSTISQQYVKNILIQRCEWNAQSEDERQSCFLQATDSSGSSGIERKLQEMRYAIGLEQKYSKNDILLGYLNIANFGGITYGIDAAARYYFGVPASNLNLSQAATLAGIVQNPNTYRIDQPNRETNGAADGYALTKKRQTYVLDRMLSDGKITQEQHDAAVAEPITPVITQPTTGCAATSAPYFCQYVVSVVKNDPAFGETAEDRALALRRGGLQIYTSLEPNIQYTASTTMSENAPQYVSGIDFGAATASIETSTGRILAISQNTQFSEEANAGQGYSSLVYAGDSTFGSSGGFQAGSTFKLFTLVDWLEQGRSVNEVLDGRMRVFKNFTNSCTGNIVNSTPINNFGKVGGSVGTPMAFTAQSLNTGYLAMAAELDMCDIAKVAKKMGVTKGNGSDITMENPSEVIGVDNVSPIAMAGAYATVANNGVYCQPQAIDRVTDASGNELPRPERTCTQVISPQVAATAAYALRGVMNGGTGSGANPYDGTQLIGKTGTHEGLQTWMIESSTRVTNAAWVGTVQGENDMFGRGLQNIRYTLAKALQRTADQVFPADNFPDPDPNLTKRVLKELPNVVGQTIDQAQTTLQGAGFEVTVGDPVDSDQPTNIVAAQSPGAGQVAGGTTVTISPSNGQGATVPAVSGKVQDAQKTLQDAGFTSIALGTCTPDDKLPDNESRATGTNPAAGTAVNRGSQILINYSKKSC